MGQASPGGNEWMKEGYQGAGYNLVDFGGWLG